MGPAALVLFFFFPSPVHVLGSGTVSNIDVERRDLFKRTLGNCRETLIPSLTARGSLRCSSLEQEACRQNETQGQRARWRGAGCGVGRGPGENCWPLPETLCLQESCPPKMALCGQLAYLCYAQRLPPSKANSLLRGHLLVPKIKTK